MMLYQIIQYKSTSGGCFNPLQTSFDLFGGSRMMQQHPKRDATQTQNDESENWDHPASTCTVERGIQRPIGMMFNISRYELQKGIEHGNILGSFLCRLTI